MLHVVASSAKAKKAAASAAYEKALAALIASGAPINKARKILSAAKAAGLPYDLAVA